MSLRGSPMLMKNDGGASFSLQRRLQPTVFALTEFRRMCGEAWAVLQGSGGFRPALSFIPQRDHWIHAGSSPRGN